MTTTRSAPVTDIYFRGFDMTFPDYYRYTEWARDFDANYATADCRHLTSAAVACMTIPATSAPLSTGINTPELDEADNDYAVGLVVQKIANSRYAHDTLIFVIEDDAQDGGDHVDAHRSIAFVVGPYVKQHAVVSTSYNTLDFVAPWRIFWASAAQHQRCAGGAHGGCLRPEPDQLELHRYSVRHAGRHGTAAARCRGEH